MDEAKYCEDIVPKLKAALVGLGWTNEHDRLGHFESKVPIDVLFGLAKGASDVRVFGMQFKALMNSRVRKISRTQLFR